jgi:hypothetical protein
MEGAARRLVPFSGPTIPLEGSVVWLTGRQHWYQTAFCLYSLQRAIGGTPSKVVICSDGSLSSLEADLLLRLCPTARVIMHGEVEERLRAMHPPARSEGFLNLRRRYVHFKKIVDIAAAAPGPALLLDSDMLFHRRPDELLEWLRQPGAPLYMNDRQESYGCPKAVMEALCGTPIPPAVNSGVVALDRSRIDWDWFAGLTESLLFEVDVNFYTEQCLYAMLMAVHGGRPLPSDQYVQRPEGAELEECTAVLHHYTWTSRLPYLERCWKRIGKAS